MPTLPLVNLAIHSHVLVQTQNIYALQGDNKFIKIYYIKFDTTIYLLHNDHIARKQTKHLIQAIINAILLHSFPHIMVMLYNFIT